jgi:molybdopterin-containing oxidoreductase family membrane subunit
LKELEDRVFSPLRGTDRRYVIWLSLLVALVVVMLFALEAHGLGPVGGSDPVLWGVFNESMVFFVGLALGGVMVSGIVRNSRDSWGPWVTRVAEATVFAAIFVALLNIIMETGDLVVLMDTVFYGELTNPLVWNGILVMMYLVIGCGILYFALVPDLNVAALWVRRWQWLYRILTFGYSATEGQRADVRRIALTVGAISTVAVVIAHTVLAWTLDGVEAQPDWNLAMSGPYFVTGGLLAAFALATAIAALATSRLNLEEAIGKVHKGKLSRALMVVIVVHLVVSVVYIQLAELTTDEGTVSLASELWTGEYAMLTWTMLAMGLLLPLVITIHPGGRTPKGLFIASGLILGTMWLRTYLVAVPGLSAHSEAVAGGVHVPSMEEWLLAVGTLAIFALILSVIYKMAPIVSLWEMGWKRGTTKRFPKGWGRGTPFYRMMYYVWVPTFLAMFSGVVAWIALGAIETPTSTPGGLGEFPSPFFMIILVTIVTLLVSFVTAFFQTKGWTAFIAVVMVFVVWLAIELLDWVVGTWGSRMILLGAAAVLGLIVGIVLFLLFVKRAWSGVWTVAFLLVLYAVLTSIAIELDAPNMFLGVFLFNTMIVMVLVGYKILITLYTVYKRWTLGA